MQNIQPEPIVPPPGHHATHPAAHGRHPVTGQVGPAVAAARPNVHLVRPADVNGLIAAIQQEFPDAHIRVTGRGRTVERQAELMADRRMQNRNQFLRTYLPAQHITEMDTWVAQNPQATRAETAAAFAGIIKSSEGAGRDSEQSPFGPREGH